MEQFKNLTIEELMELLIKLTRDNEIQAKEYNKSISSISKSKQSVSKTEEEIKELYQQILELVNENKKFVALFKELMDFSKYYNANILHQEINDGFNLEDIQIHLQANDLKDLESMNQQELNELLEQYIADEKYEECVKIKELIDKAA